LKRHDWKEVIEYQSGEIVEKHLTEAKAGVIGGQGCGVGMSTVLVQSF